MNNPQDDVTLHGYQDDFDNKNTDVDQIADEAGDDPTQTLGVPPEEFKKELDGLSIEGNNSPEGMEDSRERIEDLDQDEGDSTK